MGGRNQGCSQCRAWMGCGRGRNIGKMGFGQALRRTVGEGDIGPAFEKVKKNLSQTLFSIRAYTLAESGYFQLTRFRHPRLPFNCGLPCFSVFNHVIAISHQPLSTALSPTYCQTVACLMATQL